MWVWKSPKETSIWKGLSYLDSTCKIGLTTNLHRFPKLFHYSDKLYTWPHDSILAVSNSKVSCNESDANLWDTSTWKADHINVSAVWYQHLPSITQKKQLHTRHRQSWPIIPQKKTMKNQINTLLPTNINISPMDNPNKKKTLKNEIITSKRSRVPSRERSTITYSRLPGVEKRVFITGGVEKA